MNRLKFGALVLGVFLIVLAGCGTPTSGAIPKITGIYNGVLVLYHLPDTTSGDTLVATASITAGTGGNFTGTWKVSVGLRDSLSGTFENSQVGALSTDGNDIASLKFQLRVTRPGCSGNFTAAGGYFSRLYGVNLWSFAGAVQGSASCYKLGAAQRGVFIVIGRAFAPGRLDNPFRPVSFPRAESP